MTAFVDLGRRKLLRMGALLGICAATGIDGLLGPAAADVSIPLRLKNPHTNESYDIQLFQGGQWNPAALVVCDWIMRDWRENAVVHCDRKLYAALYVLQRYFNPREPLIINSGYRTEKTNAMLRKQSLAETGGRATWMTPAINSLHTRARAVDFVVPGASLDKVGEAIWALNLGGLGRYPTFNHMDTGGRRRWGTRG